MDLATRVPRTRDIAEAMPCGDDRRPNEVGGAAADAPIEQQEPRLWDEPCRPVLLVFVGAMRHHGMYALRREPLQRLLHQKRPRRERREGLRVGERDVIKDAALDDTKDERGVLSANRENRKAERSARAQLRNDVR